MQLLPSSKLIFFKATSRGGEKLDCLGGEKLDLFGRAVGTVSIQALKRIFTIPQQSAFRHENGHT